LRAKKISQKTIKNAKEIILGSQLAKKAAKDKEQGKLKYHGAGHHK